jgi:anti-anti-sigma factor
MATKTCLEIAREGDVAIATFTSSCIHDAEETASASAQLSNYLEANRLRRLAFDFSGVTVISSRVLSLLLETRARLEPHQGAVAIASLSPQLQRVFAIAKLDGAFHFYPDRATAVEKLLESPNDVSP